MILKLLIKEYNERMELIATGVSEAEFLGISWNP